MTAGAQAGQQLARGCPHLDCSSESPTPRIYLPFRADISMNKEALVNKMGQGSSFPMYSKDK